MIDVPPNEFRIYPMEEFLIWTEDANQMLILSREEIEKGKIFMNERDWGPAIPPPEAQYRRRIGRAFGRDFYLIMPLLTP